jgi:hypothetical protein
MPALFHRIRWTNVARAAALLLAVLLVLAWPRLKGHDGALPSTLTEPVTVAGEGSTAEDGTPPGAVVGEGSTAEDEVPPGAVEGNEAEDGTPPGAVEGDEVGAGTAAPGATTREGDPADGLRDEDASGADAATVGDPSPAVSRDARREAARRRAAQRRATKQAAAERARKRRDTVARRRRAQAPAPDGPTTTRGTAPSDGAAPIRRVSPDTPAPEFRP